MLKQEKHLPLTLLYLILLKIKKITIEMNQITDQFQITDEEGEIQGSGNLSYEQTPIYAAGEVYLPSFVDKITAEIVWLRSANRYYSYNEFYVISVGYYYSNSSNNSFCVAPAAVIC